MISWIARWWRRRQRQIDNDLLWPACKENAGSLEDARFAFVFHCLHDPAWVKDFSYEEIVKIVSNYE